MKIKATRAFTMFGAGPLGPVTAEIKPGEIIDVEEMQAHMLIANDQAAAVGKPAKTDETVENPPIASESGLGEADAPAKPKATRKK